MPSSFSPKSFSAAVLAACIALLMLSACSKGEPAPASKPPHSAVMAPTSAQVADNANQRQPLKGRTLVGKPSQLANLQGKATAVTGASNVTLTDAQANDYATRTLIISQPRTSFELDMTASLIETQSIMIRLEYRSAGATKRHDLQVMQDKSLQFTKGEFAYAETSNEANSTHIAARIDNIPSDATATKIVFFPATGDKAGRYDSKATGSVTISSMKLITG